VTTLILPSLPSAIRLEDVDPFSLLLAVDILPNIEVVVATKHWSELSLLISQASSLLLTLLIEVKFLFVSGLLEVVLLFAELEILLQIPYSTPLL